jgi:gliding motility-associated-like protein
MNFFVHVICLFTKNRKSNVWLFICVFSCKLAWNLSKVPKVFSETYFFEKTKGTQHDFQRQAAARPPSQYQLCVPYFLKKEQTGHFIMKKIRVLFGGMLLALLGVFSAVRAQCPAVPASTALGSFRLIDGNRSLIVNGVDNTPYRICPNTRLRYDRANNNQNNLGACFQVTDPRAIIPLPCNESTVVDSPPYEQPGKYAFVVQGSVNGTGFYACRVIEVVDNPTPPVFTVASCRPNEVQLVITAGNPSNDFVSYTINWGSGATGTTNQTILASEVGRVLTKTYRPGTTSTQIVVRGDYDSQLCFANGIPQTVNLTALAPAIVTTVRVTDDKTVAMDFRGTPNMPSEALLRTNNTNPPVFAPTGKKITPTSTALTNLSVGDLDATKQLNLTLKTSSTVCPDVEVQAASVSGYYTLPISVSAENNQNRITWERIPGAVTYALYQNGQLYASYNNTINTAIVQPIVCKNNYRYYVQAIVSSTNATGAVVTYLSVSQTKEVTAISTDLPPGISLAYSTVEQGRNKVILLMPPQNTSQAQTITYFRSNGDPAGPYEPLKTVAANQNSLIDEQGDPNQNYCYKASYINNCDVNSAQTPAQCPMRLTLNSLKLSWTPYVQFPNGTSFYQVKRSFVDLGGTPQTNGVNTGNVLGYNLGDGNPESSSQVEKIYVEALSNSVGGVTFTSRSNEITFVHSSKLYVPDVFTPNGDATNDVLNFYSLYMSRLEHFTVFDRWGSVVFATQSMTEGWNGLINGVPAPQGVYTYQVMGFDQLDVAMNKQGAVMLVR